MIIKLPEYFSCQRCNYTAIKNMFYIKNDSLVCPSCDYQRSYLSINAPVELSINCISPAPPIQSAKDLGLLQDWEDDNRLPCWLDEMLTKLFNAGWRKP